MVPMLFGKLPKEHRKANSFLLAYFFFLAKKKYGAEQILFF